MPGVAFSPLPGGGESAAAGCGGGGEGVQVAAVGGRGPAVFVFSRNGWSRWNWKSFGGTGWGVPLIWWGPGRWPWRPLKEAPCSGSWVWPGPALVGLHGEQSLQCLSLPPPQGPTWPLLENIHPVQAHRAPPPAAQGSGLPLGGWAGGNRGGPRPALPCRLVSAALTTSALSTDPGCQLQPQPGLTSRLLPTISPPSPSQPSGLVPGSGCSLLL